MALTENQRKTLRGLGHKLKPVVMVADKGLSPNVLHELDSALTFHELIKVSVRAGDRDERQAIIADICDKTDAENVQRIGNIVLLFRRNADAPKIVLGSR
ncbi:MAG: ribosome assembly RNA-binding protein YhbY [Pseudomonadota bacterium]